MDEKDLDFLMVGCSRCGTTWVDKALREHPEIYLPPKKQSYFFNTHYDKGIKWYLSQFIGITENHKAIGEIATYYSQPDLVPLLAKHFPNAKLMMSVRNPVERAYSYYQSRASKFDWTSIEQAIEDQPNDILERGKYIDQIETILEYFPMEQFKLVFFDDLKNTPEQFLASILGFLDVNTDFKSSQIGKMVQVTVDPRLRRTLKKIGLQPLMNYVSKKPVGDKIRLFLKSSNIRRYKPIDESDKQLLLDIYRPFNQKLQEFSGRDLAHWNK